MSETDQEVSASWLLEQARALMEGHRDVTAGRWPRAAALLGRQALEVAVDERCSTLHEELGECRSSRAQLLCLQEAVDPALAKDVTHAWYALTRACHVHAYELPPTAEELQGWLTSVERLIASTASAR